MKKPLKIPDPRSAKIMGWFMAVEVILVTLVLLGRFVFDWF